MRLRRRPEPEPERPALSAELRDALAKEIDDPKGKTTVFAKLKCSHCGGVHEHACPRVASMRFRPVSGGGIQIVEVKFWPPGEWSRDGIIWPWDVFAEGAPMPELSSPEQGSTEEETT